MLPIKKILCPTDFSEASFIALDHAVELARHFHADLGLIHVLPLVATGLPDGLSLPVGETDDERMEIAVNQLSSLASSRVPADVNVQGEVKMGYADKEIVYEAEQGHYDLLVIATHGLTGWRHLVFGSVAEAIVRQANCPVLTVRARPQTEKVAVDEAPGAPASAEQAVFPSP
jgi:nucleotide-binding universal stress UspA family protein